jgi:hypothetical protein
MHYEAVRGIQALERDLQRMDQSFLRKEEVVKHRKAGEKEDVETMVWDSEFI